MAAFIAVLNAIAAVPAFLGYVEKFGAWVTAWFIGRAKADVAASLANAAAIAANAKTDKDRIDASNAWRDAFLKPRVTP